MAHFICRDDIVLSDRHLKPGDRIDPQALDTILSECAHVTLVACADPHAAQFWEETLTDMTDSQIISHLSERLMNSNGLEFVPREERAKLAALLLADVPYYEDPGY